jgi:hypothetical protein
VNPLADFSVNVLLLWLSSGQLCTALLFFLCGYMPRRFFGLRKITAVFTFMGILPPLTAGLAQAVSRGFFFSALKLSRGLMITLVIMGIDVFFLLYLLLSRGEDTECI